MNGNRVEYTPNQIYHNPVELSREDQSIGLHDFNYIITLIYLQTPFWYTPDSLKTLNTFNLKEAIIFFNGLFQDLIVRKMVLSLNSTNRTVLIKIIG